MAAFLAGCEKKNDAAADNATAVAAGSLAVGDAAKAVTDLGDAGKATGRGGSALAAKTVLASAQLRLAGDKNNELQVVLGKINRLTDQINSLTLVISTGNVMSQGYLASNPKPVVGELASRTEAATSGKGWVESEAVKFPALSESRQNVARIQAELASAQDGLKSLEATRAGALKEVETLTASAAVKTGREQVDAYALASAARKKVSDVSSQIDLGHSRISRLLQDLALAETQQKAVEATLADVSRLSGSVTAGYQNVVKLAELQNGVAKAAVDLPTPSGTAATTKSAEGGEMKSVEWMEPVGLKDKCAKLAELVGEAKKLRGEVDALYTEAAKGFGDAFNEATEFRRASDKAMSAEFDKAITEKVTDAIKPAQSSMQEAYARIALAQSRTAYAVTLRDRATAGEKLAAALKGAGQTLDNAVDAGIAGEVKSASEGAVTEYNAAVGLMENAAGGGYSGTDKRRFAANAGAAVSHYVLALHGRLIGDATLAKAELDKALEWRKKLMDDGATIADVPSLPGELALDVPKADAPASKPSAEAPATEPAK